ncbi:TetR family transcriptional regulator [Robbsia sp. Bb-Pol-6]|uniref:TetR family transcriptional regulator n=1 Tax=Robbsia betulipollinis TaxID=2981849 RepID=A0ABT3ZM79_9BURK|nr:TetR family transcriptional regulator [Robbsia betulipollinis]MCY0387517.1 TetR family transcriptional regulator [Robbsia betulipollinis]
MARRTKEEAQATRSLILDTAERTFSENGVSHTSLSDIAVAAGLTRGAIYWHFKNKCELFSAMVDRELLPLDELLATTFDTREADPLQRLRDIIVGCLCDMMRNPRRRTIVEILLLKWEHTKDMQPVIDRKQVNVRQGIERMQRGLDNAVAKAQLPAALDTHRAAQFLHALIVGVMSDYLTASEHLDILVEAPRLIDGYLDMLRLSPAMRRSAAPA